MLETNQIICGNSLDLLKQVDNDSIDLHMHSPPYGKMKSYGICQGIEPDKYVEWYLNFSKEIYRTLKSTGVLILNINDCVINKTRHYFVYELVYRMCKEQGWLLAERLFWNKGKSLCHPKKFRDVAEYIFVFSKTNDFYMDINEMRVPYNIKSLKRMERPIKKRFNRSLDNQDKLEYKNWSSNKLGALPGTILSIGSESKRVSNINFAVYPEKLCNYLIKGFSRTNQLVCDIFSGSGTTCLSAKKLGRNYLGFEIQPEAVEESIARLNNIQLELDKTTIDKIQKDHKISQDYKEKTQDANFGEY